MASTLQQLLLRGGIGQNVATGAFERGQAQELGRQATRTQTARQQQAIDLAPAAEARAEEQLLINQRVSENARIKAEQEAIKLKQEGRLAEIAEDERTSKQFVGITDQAGIDAFIASNPIDGEALKGLQFGTPEFSHQMAIAEGIVSGLGDLPSDDPLSAAAKLTDDFRNKRISKDVFDAGIAKLTSVSKGTQFTLNPDGSFSFSQGGVAGEGGVPLTTGATTALQKEITTGQEAIGQLQELRANFDPKFLEFAPRIGFAWENLKGKLGINDLSDSERREARQFNIFKRDGAALMNTALKIASGTAVTEPEFNRKKAELPVVGTGLFDGDSPQEFIDKADDLLAFLKLADVRKNYAVQQGQNFDFITMERMSDIINARGKQMIDGGMTKEQAKIALKEEFGI